MFVGILWCKMININHGVWWFSLAISDVFWKFLLLLIL